MKNFKQIAGIQAGIVLLCVSASTSAATVWTASWDQFNFVADIGAGVTPYCNPFIPCPDIKYFEKEAGADWSEAGNQDLITGGGAGSGTGVTLTRADYRGLFNIAQESGFQPPVTNSPSPVDTQWAFGSTADLNTNLNPSGTLFADDFSTWGDNVFFFGPPATVDVNMVIHLITDDIYLDFRLADWTIGDTPGCDDDGFCGGVAYLRANGANEETGVTVTASPSPVPVPAALWLFGSGLLGLIGFARKKAA